ncbi:MAG: translation initiation factor [Bacteroidales bacterium]|nr:translation initiation factor [Bacteroidales bacterium]
MADDWRDALRGLMPEQDVQQADEPAPVETQRRMERPRLHVALERKGRGGKTATIIYGFPESWTDAEVAEVASTLKRRLGTGGSSRGGEILIQGDRVADVRRELDSMFA